MKSHQLLNAGLLSLVSICSYATAVAQESIESAKTAETALDGTEKPSEGASESRGQSGPGKESGDKRVIESLEDLKKTAQTAFGIVRSGDVRHRDFDEVLEKLRPYSWNSESKRYVRNKRLKGGQKKLVESLADSMAELSKTKSFSWSTNENGGQLIEGLRKNVSDRKKDVKASAGVIAVEYLAIGDLADKLQATTQAFQTAMTAKEALELSIASLNSPVCTNISEDEEAFVNGILDEVYSDPTPQLRQPRGVIKDGTAPINLDKAFFNEADSDIPAADAYVSFCQRVYDSGLRSVDLIAYAKNLQVGGNVMDDGKTLKKLLKLVDAVPALREINGSDELDSKDPQAKKWTPKKDVVRVKRIAVRLQFWNQYVDRLIQKVTEVPSELKPISVVTSTSDYTVTKEQTKTTLEIYQQIRVSLWQSVGGAEGVRLPTGEGLVTEQTYRVLTQSKKESKPDAGDGVVEREYKLPEPDKATWVRFAIPPSRPKAKPSTGYVCRKNSVLGDDFSSPFSLKNDDPNTWKFVEFHANDGEWKAQEGRSLQLKGSYRLTAGTSYVAPAPVKDGWFSVAIPPGAIEKLNVDAPDTGEEKPIDMRVQISGIGDDTKPTMFENKHSKAKAKAWEVVRFESDGNEWKALDAADEAKKYQEKTN